MTCCPWFESRIMVFFVFVFGVAFHSFFVPASVRICAMMIEVSSEQSRSHFWFSFYCINTVFGFTTEYLDLINCNYTVRCYTTYEYVFVYTCHVLLLLLLLCSVLLYCCSCSCCCLLLLFVVACRMAKKMLLWFVTKYACLLSL